VNAVTQALLPAFKEKAMTYLKAHPDVAAKVAAGGK
jgi:2-oxo-4-hydroxy-4-carboxy--5-ureidoimidazoline (OHCU) decarboxylase